MNRRSQSLLSFELADAVRTLRLGGLLEGDRHRVASTAMRGDRAHEDERFDTRPFGRGSELEGSFSVCSTKLSQRVVSRGLPDVDMCSEMHHGLLPRESFRPCHGREDVVDQELFGVCGCTTRSPDDRSNVVTVIDKALAHRSADESIGARDGHSHGCRLVPSSAEPGVPRALSAR